VKAYVPACDAGDPRVQHCMHCMHGACVPHAFQGAWPTRIAHTANALLQQANCRPCRIAGSRVSLGCAPARQEYKIQAGMLCCGDAYAVHTREQVCENPHGFKMRCQMKLVPLIASQQQALPSD
jgi:hypothetical protein